MLLPAKGQAGPVLLKMNDPAPYTGWLFSQDEEVKLRYELSKITVYEQVIESMQRSIDIHKGNEKIEMEKNRILIQRNDDLAKQLSESNRVKDWEKVLWFAGGAIITGLIGYGVVRAYGR